MQNFIRRSSRPLDVHSTDSSRISRLTSSSFVGRQQAKEKDTSIIGASRVISHTGRSLNRNRTVSETNTQQIKQTFSQTRQSNAYIATHRSRKKKTVRDRIFGVSLHHTMRKMSLDARDSNAQIKEATAAEAKQSALLVSAAVRGFVSRKECLECLGDNDLQGIHANLLRLLSIVSSIRDAVDEDHQRKSSSHPPFCTDQSILATKTLALTLSRETSDLIKSVTPSACDQAVAGVSPAMLRECRDLAGSVSNAVAAASNLVPCDALRTLRTSRGLLGAAILRRMGLNACAAVPEPEADRLLRELFDDFDADQSGRISRPELAAALAMLDLPADDAALDGLVAAADTDGDGEISMPEFLRLARGMLAANGVRIVPAAVAALIQSASQAQETGVASSDADADDIHEVEWEALLSSVDNDRRPPASRFDAGAWSPRCRVRHPACGSPLRRGGPLSPMVSGGTESPLRTKLLMGHGRSLPCRGNSPARLLGPAPGSPVRRIGSPVRRRPGGSPKRMFGSLYLSIQAGGDSPVTSPTRRPGPTAAAGLRSPLRLAGGGGSGEASPVRSLAACGGYSHLQAGSRGRLFRRMSSAT
jgi:hypothetical protein